MSAEPSSRVIISKHIPDIPLHLVPKTIADQINGNCQSVYRITAMKTFQNRFTLIIETRKRTRRSIQPEGLTRIPGP